MTKKIWVVDDDEGILEAAEIVLQAEGYEVQTFLDGQSLLGRDFIKAAEVPDLIILDVLLSGEDGRDICKSLKSRAETAHVPIIMSSANTSAGKISTDTYGAEAFLAKPFDIDNLVEVVEKYLAVQQRKQ